MKIYRNTSIILSVVSYGFETSSLTLREEYGARVLENGALKKIFGPERRK
jgi:hypothetical protein